MKVGPSNITTRSFILFCFILFILNTLSKQRQSSVANTVAKPQNRPTFDGEEVRGKIKVEEKERGRKRKKSKGMKREKERREGRKKKRKVQSEIKEENG